MRRQRKGYFPKQAVRVGCRSPRDKIVKELASDTRGGNAPNIPCFGGIQGVFLGRLPVAPGVYE